MCPGDEGRGSLAPAQAGLQVAVGGMGRVAARGGWVHPTESKPAEKLGNANLSCEAESSRRFGVTTEAQEPTGPTVSEVPTR